MDISQKLREKQNGHQAVVVWFTGLPASGKTTTADLLEKELLNREYQVTSLDGDRMRKGLCKDLGFSQKDRDENIRRVAEVAKLFRDIGQIVICSFISPFQKEREQLRKLIGEESFLEVYMKTSLQTCINRDPKGHYQRAIRKEIQEFTGISSPYEEPAQPDLVLESEKHSPEVLLQQLIEFLQARKIIPVFESEEKKLRAI